MKLNTDINSKDRIYLDSMNSVPFNEFITAKSLEETEGYFEDIFRRGEIVMVEQGVNEFGHPILEMRVFRPETDEEYKKRVSGIGDRLAKLERQRVHAENQQRLQLERLAKQAAAREEKQEKYELKELNRLLKKYKADK